MVYRGATAAPPAMPRRQSQPKRGGGFPGGHVGKALYVLLLIASASLGILFPFARLPTLPHSAAGGGAVANLGVQRGKPDDPLVFLQIPLNGGEDIGLNESGDLLVWGTEDPCLLLNAAPSSSNTFCITRDPYERLVSEFQRTSRGDHRTVENCVVELNKYVQASLEGPQSGTSKCTFMPQAAYVYGWDRERSKVDEGRRRCAQVLPFDRLSEEVNSLLEDNHLPRWREGPPRSSTVCAMLTGRNLETRSRALVETTFRDDFRLLGFKKPSLQFIHIPRTGGTTVEDIAERFELWGKNHPAMKGTGQNIGAGRCFRQHIPPSQLAEVYGGQETFCIVRDVYARVISEFGFHMLHKHNYDCDAAGLNKYVVDFLDGKEKKIGQGFPYGNDCHFLPQAAYVYGWDPVQGRVDRTKRWCTHVVDFARMRKDLNHLWFSRGYSLRLERQQALSTRTKNENCTRLKPKDLDSTSLEIIQRTYRDDLDLLAGLEGAPGYAPEIVEGAQTLVSGNVTVTQNMVATDAVVTAPEFELSFDIMPLGLVSDSYASILRITNTSTHYGHAGDRMPAFLLVQNTTRLAVHMGRPDDHNIMCAQPVPGLPMREVSHVTARLQGPQFKVSVNGEVACTIDGYANRYEAVAGADLLVGDSFNSAARAQVARVVYTRLAPLP